MSAHHSESTLPNLIIRARSLTTFAITELRVSPETLELLELAFTPTRPSDAAALSIAGIRLVQSDFMPRDFVGIRYADGSFSIGRLTPEASDGDA